MLSFTFGFLYTSSTTHQSVSAEGCQSCSPPPPSCSAPGTAWCWTTGRFLSWIEVTQCLGRLSPQSPLQRSPLSKQQEMYILFRLKSISTNTRGIKNCTLFRYIFSTKCFFGYSLVRILICHLYLIKLLCTLLQEGNTQPLKIVLFYNSRKVSIALHHNKIQIFSPRNLLIIAFMKININKDILAIEMRKIRSVFHFTRNIYWVDSQ